MSKTPEASCGFDRTCKWRADLFNASQPDAHYQITCYGPDGPAEVAQVNPELVLEHAARTAALLAAAPALRAFVRHVAVTLNGDALSREGAWIREARRLLEDAGLLA